MSRQCLASIRSGIHEGERCLRPISYKSKYAMTCGLHLNREQEIYNRITAAKKIQKWRRENVQKRPIRNYLKGREFNEWVWSPTGIGGRRHKRSMEQWFEKLKTR